MRVVCLVDVDPGPGLAQLGWTPVDAESGMVDHCLLVDRLGVVVGALVPPRDWDQRLQDWLRQQASVGRYPVVVMAGQLAAAGPFLDEVSRYADVDLVFDGGRVAEFLAQGGLADG